MATPLVVEPYGGGAYLSGWQTKLDPNVFWTGIVAPRESWPKDSDEEQQDSAGAYKSYGLRVRVRIHGYHSPSKKELADDQLPIVPVAGSTCGSGHKMTGLSPGITQGSLVVGFWLNNELKQNPIVLCTLPNNDQLKLPKVQGENGFLPFSGISEKLGDRVASYSFPALKGNPIEGYCNPNLKSLSDIAMMQEPAYGLNSPTECEKIPLMGIQKAMQELIQKIEKAQLQLQRWENAAQKWISDKQRWIQDKIAKAQEFIATGLKWVFKEIRKYLEEQINKKVKPLFENINPPDRDKAKKGHDIIIELLVCLYNKIIGNLGRMVGSFLRQMLDRYVNVPACAIQNFIGGLLGGILGALGGAIDSIISKVSGLIGGVFSLAGSILGLLKALAGFFSCEETQKCPNTKEWSIFDGGKPPVQFNIASILNQAKSLAGQAAGLVDIANIGNFNFNDLINQAVNSANSCNVGPVFCGPPKVTFWGGDGGGANGNVIVSAVGDILGVDVILGGSYKKAPFVDISDNCGKGSGVRATAITEPTGDVDEDGDPTVRVVNVVINDPGSGFIPRPDGDLGGDGRVWAPADWTVVRRDDGRWDRYPPENSGDDVINAQPGDEVIRPEDRVVFNGAGGLPIFGGGGTGVGVGDSIGDQVAQTTGITAIPGTGPNGATELNSFPTMSIGSYPTILYLCGVDIERSGINYSSEDKIIIEPNTAGVELVPIFGPFGVLDSVKIINSGKGFTERPNIYIESETGYNAKITPIFCIDRIGDDERGEIPFNTPGGVVTVIDCVGRISDKTFVGFVNGEAYYGPYHLWKGKKMVGQRHTNNGAPFIYQTYGESVQNYDDEYDIIDGKIYRLNTNTRIY